MNSIGEWDDLDAASSGILSAVLLPNCSDQLVILSKVFDNRLSWMLIELLQLPHYDCWPRRWTPSELGWLKLLSLSSFTPPAIISFECFHDSTAPVGLKDETVRTATLVVLWTAGSHNASRSGCSGLGCSHFSGWIAIECWAVRATTDSRRRLQVCEWWIVIQPDQRNQSTNTDISNSIWIYMI